MSAFDIIVGARLQRAQATVRTVVREVTFPKLQQQHQNGLVPLVSNNRARQ